MAPLERLSATLWSIHCDQCGDYRFDTPFAEFVKQGRAQHRDDVLTVVTRIAVTLRERHEPVLVTLSNYQRLAEPDAFNDASKSSGRFE
jgi:hypothetical protein